MPVITPDRVLGRLLKFVLPKSILPVVVPRWVDCPPNPPSSCILSDKFLPVNVVRLWMKAAQSGSPGTIHRHSTLNRVPHINYSKFKLSTPTGQSRTFKIFGTIIYFMRKTVSGTSYILTNPAQLEILSQSQPSGKGFRGWCSRAKSFKRMGAV